MEAFRATLASAPHFFAAAIAQIAEWIDYTDCSLYYQNAVVTGFNAAFWWMVALLLITLVVHCALKILVNFLGWLLRERLTAILGNAILLSGFGAFGLATVVLFFYCLGLRTLSVIFYILFCIMFKKAVKLVYDVLFPGIKYLPPWYQY